MPERLECDVLQKERYINPLTSLPTHGPILESGRGTFIRIGRLLFTYIYM